MEFYNSLLQITVRSHGIIFDLESKNIREVDSIESIDQLQNPDAIVNTGFIMSASQDVTKHQSDNQVLRRTQIFTNEYVNLIFRKIQDRYSNKREFSISGMLYRTFAEIDLEQLNSIFTTI